MMSRIRSTQGIYSAEISVFEKQKVHSMSISNKIRNYLFGGFRFVNSWAVNMFCAPVIDVLYHGFWNYRNYLIKSKKERTGLYDAYLERNCASIGLKSQFRSIPVTPHGLHGIHISDGAMLGDNITIMQNVTIGSNTLIDSKRTGAPHIGNNVFIGANSSIIGGITIGNNCRIGANCCVFKNIPDNQTVVSGGGLRCIEHDQPKDNVYRCMQEFESYRGI